MAMCRLSLYCSASTDRRCLLGIGLATDIIQLDVHTNFENRKHPFAGTSLTINHKKRIEAEGQRSWVPKTPRLYEP